MAFINNSIDQESRHCGLIAMLFLSLLVGIITGFSAVGFLALIGFIHNLLFYGAFSFKYNANLHALPSKWGIAVIFIPVVGAIAVAWMVKKFAPEAKGHGIPEVMDAVYYNEGKMKPIVALIKYVASSISIGTGGSAGREGPICQIGSVFASTLGQMFRIPPRQAITLIAAGAGAGIAATFNAPIGGLAFAMEIMLVSVNATTVSMVAIAAATATYIGRIFFGTTPTLYIPTLEIPSFHISSPYILLLFIPLGLLMGLASTLFIKSLYWFEEFFDNMPGNYYTRHTLGMFFLGVIIYILMRYTGHYFVQGVGYSTIVDVLKELLSNPWLLFLLFVCKLLATNLTLGSGASGGIFSPSLFMGATLGATFGAIMHWILPGLDINTSMFALAGMAAMVAGSTGAIMTAVAMSFELTHDYNSILPIVITVALASGIRKYICYESIYTLKLLRRGIIVPEGLQAAITSANRARDVMEKTFHLISVTQLNKTSQVELKGHPFVIVEKHGEITGVLRSKHFTQGDITAENYEDFINSNYIMASPFTGLVNLSRRMQEKEADIILVSRTPRDKSAKNLLGVITAKEISSSLMKTAKLMS